REIQAKLLKGGKVEVPCGHYSRSVGGLRDTHAIATAHEVEWPRVDADRGSPSPAAVFGADYLGHSGGADVVGRNHGPVMQDTKGLNVIGWLNLANLFPSEAIVHGFIHPAVCLGHHRIPSRV